MRVVAPYLFAIAFVLLQVPAVQAATPSEIFVQQNIDTGYAILKDSALPSKERAEKFRTLLQSIVDTKRVAVFTLGSFAHSAPGAQIEEFESAFSDFFTDVLQHDLAGSPGEKISVSGSLLRAPDDVIVTARLIGSPRSNGAPVNLAFRIRPAANRADSIVDLQVEGIWMALAQRSDFSAWLQQHHGDVSTLSAELESRAQLLRASDTIAQAGNRRDSK